MSKFEWSKGFSLRVQVHLSNTFMNELTAVHLHGIHDIVTVVLLFSFHNRRKCTQYDKWAPSRENLSSGFPSKRVSNRSPQLLRLARKLKFDVF